MVCRTTRFIDTRQMPDTVAFYRKKDWQAGRNETSLQCRGCTLQCSRCKTLGMSGNVGLPSECNLLQNSTGNDQGLTLAITTRSFSFGLAATASPNFLYSGVRCLQCPHLHHAVQSLPRHPVFLLLQIAQYIINWS